MVNNVDKKERGVDFSLLISTLTLTVAACVVIFTYPEATDDFLTKIFVWGTGSFGWVFILFTIGGVALNLWFIFGPYANKRLGDDPPERSTFSWLSLVFVGGSSASVVYWAVVEFYYYLQTPPFGLEPFSKEAYTWASTYGAYHWGFVPFSMYSAVAVLFAFMLFVKKVDTSRISMACTSVIGEKNANGFLGKVFDASYLTGVLLVGAGATLGMSTPLVGTLIARFFGIEHSLAVDAALIVAWTSLFTLTVYTGLQKGMKYVAELRVWLIFVLLIFILIAGPTSFIIGNTIESIGTQGQNIIKMTTFVDVLGESGFPQNWTIFFWASFIAAILWCGLYYGRISQGRTVRQVALGVCLAGGVGTMMFFWVMGNYSIHVHIQDPAAFAALMATDPYDAIIYVWSQLPFKNVVLGAFLVYAFISVWSHMQSISYVLAMVAEKGLSGTDEPGKVNRVFWCSLLGVLALALLFIGGLQTVKNAVILSAIPALILASICVVALMKDMFKIWGLPHAIDGKSLKSEEGAPVETV